MGGGRELHDDGRVCCCTDLPRRCFVGKFQSCTMRIQILRTFFHDRETQQSCSFYEEQILKFKMDLFAVGLCQFGFTFSHKKLFG
jgi:hypothetical protein